MCCRHVDECMGIELHLIDNTVEKCIHKLKPIKVLKKYIYVYCNYNVNT